MSDIYALQRELRRSAEEMNALRRRMADFAREQERKYKHEIDVLEKKTQTAMEARDSVMAGQYEARLRELQKNTPERRDVS